MARFRLPLLLVLPAGIGALLVAALATQLNRPAPNFWWIFADVSVGLAFVLAAALAPGPALQRMLVLATGAIWLLGSSVPVTQVTHQAILALALIGYPSGIPRGTARRVVACTTPLIAVGVVPQPVVALIFAAVAIVTVPKDRMRRAAAWFPTVAAAGLAMLLGGSWLTSRLMPTWFSPSLSLIFYELALVLIAAGFVIAARTAAARNDLTELVLGPDALVGLDGLATVLGEALHDPTLKIHRRLGSVPDAEDSEDSAAENLASNRRRLQVLDDGELIAVIEHDSADLDDPKVADSVASAVRLALVNLQLTEQLHRQAQDLENAHARLLNAAEHERAVMAARLREDVVTPVQRARNGLLAVRASARTPDAAAAIDTAVRELSNTGHEVLALVAGLPSEPLGDGRLQSAITELARHSDGAVEVSAERTATADASVETALFYVCSEALANALKHSGARHIAIRLTADDDSIALAVVDDGCGGADPSGSGLAGLAQRVIAYGGRLRVESEPGAGTMVSARLPRRPSATV